MHVYTLLIALTLVAARNPINTSAGWGGIADPHVRVFNGVFYLYTTHDFAPQDKGFINKDWRIFSSPDLLTWTLESTLLPNATPARLPDYSTCWATDAAQGPDGRFYFYLSIGHSQIAVMRGDTPTGPWVDVLGQPLINQTLGAALNTEARDPGILADEDGSHYLVFGTFNYYIARLGPDMMSLAEAPRAIAIATVGGGPPTSQNGLGILDDKPFLHKKSGAYYFSFGGFYGTGASPYGPFVQHDPTWVSPALIAPDFSLPGSSGPCWCQQTNYNDRHGSFFSAQGQDFWSSNDRSHSSDAFNTNFYRDTILTYVHYLSNGSIAPVVIDAVGVGSYEAALGVEAENYFALRGPSGRKWHDAAGRRFAVTGLREGSAVSYPHIAGTALTTRLVLRCASAGGPANASASAPAVVAQLRAVEAGGARLLCAAELRGLAGGRGGEAESDWQDIACDMAQPLGANELHLELQLLGGGVGEAEGVLLDKISFEG